VPAVTGRGAADRGELAIVLHSHMPYVEGFGTWPFGEEWLLEAIASSYLPLLRVLEAAAARGQRGVATVGITPVLADQLVLRELGHRFLRFMREVRRDCHRQDAAGLDDAGRHAEAQSLRRSARDYEWAADDFEQRAGDLLGALLRLQRADTIDLWASAATHAVLPLLATEQGLRLQLGTGIAAHRERFGSWRGGFWLPECGYRPGIEDPLAAAGVRAFCVDQTAHADSLDQLEPVAAGSAVAIPIDWQTISLVWDDHGYPADPVYRDYHAQTVNGMRAWSNSGAPYEHDTAAARARAHAEDFVDRVLARAEAYRSARGRPALVVCALDTELLGHWWYEGPQWLGEVIELAAERGLRLTTLPAGLEGHEPVTRSLAESSWGDEKDLRTWDSPAVAEFAWTAREAELDLVGVIGGADRSTLADRAAAARRAARELLALQSSDWAFMSARGLAGDYPATRARNHASRFEEALIALRDGMAHFRAMQPGTGHGAADLQGNAAFDERLRGLAPGLELAPLLEPVSAWGRDPRVHG
jgi:1,4-alpha-glucan branching enzyme